MRIEIGGDAEFGVSQEHADLDLAAARNDDLCLDEL